MEASEAEVVVARVVGGQVDEGRVKGVELEDGRVLACDLAVLCMGPWTGEIHLKYLLFNEMTIPRASPQQEELEWQNMFTEEKFSV